jgi:hypothetical protein
MIRGYTIFFHKQRQTDEDGFLLAEKEDFERAKELFNSQLSNVVSKLNEREIKIMNFIHDNDFCNINEIATGTGLAYTTVRNIIKGRTDRHNTGLLSKVEGLAIVKGSGISGNFNNHSERFYVSSNEKWKLSNDFVTWIEP